MLLSRLLLSRLLLLGVAHGVVNGAANTETITPTVGVEAVTASGAASSTDEALTAVPLMKRYQKVRLPKTTTTSSSVEQPQPWVRTIYDDVVEIVTPTIIGGVTFFAKPPADTGLPQPWISLNKNGSPKTITPQLKNGRTKNASPTYSTYFQTATTITYGYDDLKAHNMDPGAIHTEVEWIPEDGTYVDLNPLVRCTPEFYRKQGIARDRSSEPFCTPYEKTELAMGKTYFITWYTNFFQPHEEYVRLHFTYVKESLMEKGMKKRDVEGAFFSTPWIENLHGFYAFEIQEEWLLNDWIQPIAVSLQPKSVPDDEFDLLKDATMFKIARGTKVSKNTKEMRARQDQGISDDTWYYVMLSVPSVICVSALGMYFFVWLTRGDRDISAIRRQVYKQQHKILGKFKPSSKNKKYSELPQFDRRGGPKLS